VTCVQVVDIQRGESLEQGSTGELCVKSPAMMLGYANNPEATAATIDSDGWLHTGNSIITSIRGYFGHNTYGRLLMYDCCDFLKSTSPISKKLWGVPPFRSIGV